MKLETLKNLAVFLERVQVVGKEAYAWAVAHQEVQAEIANLTLPVAPADVTGTA